VPVVVQHVVAFVPSSWHFSILVDDLDIPARRPEWWKSTSKSLLPLRETMSKWGDGENERESSTFVVLPRD